MPSGQAKLLARTLRFRLTAWNTVVLLLGVMVALLVVRQTLRTTLTHEVDRSLVDAVAEGETAINRFAGNSEQIIQELQAKAESNADRGMFIELRDGSGRLIWVSPLSPPLDRLSLPSAGDATSISFLSNRVSQKRITLGSGTEYCLRVGSDLKSVDVDVATVSELMLWALLAVLCLAPLGGYWLAGQATAPFDRIIRTAKRLRPSHLEERLPVRGSGDELDQLSVTINRLLDQIADYLERNREFVANAAHELRSPLTAIQSSVEVALNSDRPVNEYQDLLVDVSEEIGQLSVLVNQLLVLTETDAERVQVQRHSIRFDQLVLRSIDMFRGVAEERGINLDGAGLGEVTMEADSHRLRQVINNLIDNALKFTPLGGAVQVRVFTDAPANWAILEVENSGPGIDAADIPHIFDRFYRGDKARQREDSTRGSGLGLSICRSIVSAHGGNISVRSVPSVSTAFRVELPLRLSS